MRRRGEAGATLIEMLAAVTILGVIGAVLTEAVIIGIDTAGRTEDEVSESLDRQLVSSYFVGDVQSAQQVRTDAPCAGPVPGADLKLTLSWSDGEQDKAASYLVEAGDTPAERRLVRRYCVNGSQAAVNRVASSLAEEDPVAVEVATDPGPPATVDKVIINIKDTGYQECLEALQDEFRCKYRLEAVPRATATP